MPLTRRLVTVLSWAAASLVALGCSDAPDAPVSSSVAMSLSVTSAPAATPTVLTLTLRNAGARPLRLEGCPDVPAFEIQGFQGTAWLGSSQVNVLCQAIFTTLSVSLSPGESLVRSFPVSDTGTIRALVYVADAGSGIRAQFPSPAVVVR